MSASLADADKPIDRATIDNAVDALLDKDPDAFLSTLGDDGFVVPVPEGFERADRHVTWRKDRTIMVDVVVPGDALTVISTWERCRRLGMASGTVRMANDPTQVMTLTLVDQRDRYGVWLAIFTHDDSMIEAAPVEPDQRSLAPLRPRTVSMKKNFTAMITEIEDNVTKLLGWPAELIVGARSSDFIHPDDQERAIDSWVQMLANQLGQRVRFRHRCLDGSWLWVEVDNTYIHSEDPDAIEVVAQVTDISDEMAAHDAVQQREELFRRLAESLPIGLFQVEQDRSILYANDRVEEVLGIAPQATLADQLGTVVDDDRAELDLAFEAVLGQGIDSELEVQVRHPATGQVRQCVMSLVALGTDADTPGVIVTVNDVTDSVRLREELKVMATFDPLTGCLTRRAFLTALDEVLAGPDRRNAGVIFVDLDNFKPVNDQLGHGAGDELLRHVADAIRDVLREDDFVGRFGGDEFLIACQGMGERDQALAVAERVRQALSGTVALSTGAVDLKASIGIACADDSTTREALVAHADEAMYRSKRAGQGAPVLHGRD